ncbi:hypothetical protein M0Q97_12640 [Candidatus Dojkabacteria bacterium]|jgi:hypothetical protein|nr:hypothetical protein [Candidatus Dojkabacteria bacterium]
MEKKLVSWTHSVGNYGEIEIDIHIGMSKHELSEDDKKPIHDFCRKINSCLIDKIYENDENLKIRGEKEKQELIDLFKNHSLIFVKEILNQYDGSVYPGYSKHFPWLEITTTIGTFTIGWRKRVIQIDWSNTIINFEAEHIFPDEDVTKGEKYIHAWGIEKAQQYIDKIFSII